MEVAITGSSGLIGKALTLQLALDGHNPVRVTRSGSEGIHWDPAKGEIDAASFEGIDAVVHLAGAGIGDRRWSDKRKQLVLDSRVDGTTLLSETLANLNRPPSLLLSGSAIGFYGHRGDEQLTESSARGTGFLADVCVAWEAATAAADQSDIRVVHLRTGIVLSTDGGALPKFLPLFKFGLGGKFGDGKQYFSWVSIDDQVRAISWLIDNAEKASLEGPVNITGPEPVTNAGFTKALGSVLKRPTFLSVPKFGPKLLLGGEMADGMLFDSTRVIPSVLSDAGFSFSHPTVDAALRAVLGRTSEEAA